MTEICLWKNLYNDPKSTIGIDMRKSKSNFCGKCVGTEAGAKENNCSKFLLNGEVNTVEKPIFWKKTTRQTSLAELAEA